MYFYRANQYTFPTHFHVIHKYSLNIRKETCFFVSLCHKMIGPPLCHLDQWLIFYWPKKKISGQPMASPHFRHCNVRYSLKKKLIKHRCCTINAIHANVQQQKKKRKHPFWHPGASCIDTDMSTIPKINPNL